MFTVLTDCRDLIEMYHAAFQQFVLVQTVTDAYGASIVSCHYANIDSPEKYYTQCKYYFQLKLFIQPFYSWNSGLEFLTNNGIHFDYGALQQEDDPTFNLAYALAILPPLLLPEKVIHSKFVSFITFFFFLLLFTFVKKKEAHL